MIFNMEKEKYNLHDLSIILGTHCNMNCKHCCGGDIKQHIELDLKCIENIIPEIYGIVTLGFVGYETTLYIDKMQEIFELLIQNNVRVNMIKVNTNGKTYSQELVDFLKSSKDYVIYPKQSRLLISYDSFHFQNDNDKADIIANTEKYQRELADICYVGKIEELDSKLGLIDGLMLTGRAKQLTKEEIQDIPRIYTYTTNKEKRLYIKSKCDGVENMCKNINGDCVKNCIDTPLILTPNGYLYVSNSVNAFNALAENNYNDSIGNILDNSFREIIDNTPHKKEQPNNLIIIQNAKDPIWRMEYRLFKATYFKEQLRKNFYDKNVRKHYELWEQFDNEYKTLEIFRKPLRWSDGLNTVPEMSVFIAVKEIFLKTMKLCGMIDVVMKSATVNGIPHYEEFCNIVDYENDNCIQGIEKLWGNYEIWYNKWVSYENWEINDIVKYAELLMQEMKS